MSWFKPKYNQLVIWATNCYWWSLSLIYILFTKIFWKVVKLQRFFELSPQKFWKFMIQFDNCAYFFRWVGEKPPTRKKQEQPEKSKVVSKACYNEHVWACWFGRHGFFVQVETRCCLDEFCFFSSFFWIFSAMGSEKSPYSNTLG